MNKFLTLVFIILISLIFACKSSKNRANLIIGSWHIDNIEVNQQMSASEKANFGLYLAQLKETSYFTFSNDYKYESLYNDDISKGVWELSKDGMMLITKPDDKDADTVKVAELNASTLILLSESDGVTTKIIMKKQK